MTNSVKFAFATGLSISLFVPVVALADANKISGTYLVQSSQTCVLSAYRSTQVANPPTYTVSEQNGVSRIAFTGSTTTALTTSTYVVVINPQKATWKVPEFKLSIIVPSMTSGSTTDQVTGRANATFQVDRATDTLQVLNTVTTWIGYTGTETKQETPVDVKIASFDNGETFINVLDARTVRMNTYTPVSGSLSYNDTYCDRLMSGRRISKKY